MQKTAYEMRISDWSSDVCSSDLLARPGTAISLRVPRPAGWSLDELAAHGAVGRRGAQLLRRIIGSRLSFLVSGGPGTGKTPLLPALLAEADPAHRTVLVGDFSDLRPDPPHVLVSESPQAHTQERHEEGR